MKTPLAKLHAWMAIGFSGCYCGIIQGVALGTPERLIMIGLGIIGIMAALEATRGVTGIGTTREAVLSYCHSVWHAGLGWGATASTIAVVMVMLGLAVGVGSSLSEWGLATADGLRNAIFLTVGAYVWRLKGGLRVVALLGWIICDVITYGTVVIPGVGNAIVTMVVGTIAAWCAMEAQDRLDRAFGGERSR